MCLIDYADCERCDAIASLLFHVERFEKFLPAAAA
jgi:hypothetical protein